MNRRSNTPVHIAPEPRDMVRRRARTRSKLVGLGVAAVLLAIAGRGAQLCIDPHTKTMKMGSGQRWGQETFRAPRGDILDRDGRRLATSVDAPSVVVDPMLVDASDVDGLARDVAAILDLPVAQVADKMKRDSRYARLKSRVHPREAKAIEDLGHRSLWTQRDPRRYYPEEGLGAQILGFVDSKGTGKAGLEAALDLHLRGGSILVTHRRSRRGYDLDPHQVRQTPDEGLDVHTTIDRSIQRVAERALAGVVERHAPHAAYATVVDIKTGDVLAIANAPSFNPNAIGSDPSVRRNHALQDAIEPGSVFKPFTLAAVIEDGLVNVDSIVDCEGGAWYIGRTRIRDDHPHRLITAGEVVKYSSNICSAKFGLQLGPERFMSYLDRFGFGQRTGVGLPGERRGFVRDPAKVKPIELATTAFGQGVTSTQIQLAMATASIANRGVLMKPRLVTLVADADGVPVFEQPVEERHRVVSESTALQVTKAMKMVTEQGGTAPRARVAGYKVAGKTGTAQKPKNGGYGEGRIGSFMGFLPADDPAVAIVVTVDEPTKGSGYGGINAAPAFAEIGAYTMRHLGIAPDPELVDIPEPEPDDIIEPEEPIRLAWLGNAWSVPDLSGRPVREVLQGIQGTGLRLELDGTGRVISQSPSPGDRIPAGGSLSVVLR